MAGDQFDLMKGLVANDALATEDQDTGESPSSGIVGSHLFDENSGPGYWIEEDAQTPLQLTFADLQITPGEVIRLNPAALWFVPSTGDRFPPREIRFYLRRGRLSIGPLRGKVVHLNARSQRPCIGLRLIDVSIDAGRQIVALLNELIQKGSAKIAHDPSPVLEDIVDPERICAILTALIAVGSEGLLAEGERRVQASIVRVDAEAGRIHWKTDGRLLEPGASGEQLRARVVGYNSVYRFYLSDVEDVDGGIVASLPTRIDRVRHRFLRRVPVSTSVRVRFEHPIWEEIEPTWRDVLDISLGGIRFTINPDEDLVFPALNLPYIEIETQYGTVIHLRGQVRNVVAARDGQPSACGASVTPISPEDEIWWMRLVSGMLYDHSTQTSEHLTEPLWDLFKDSGYMNLAGRSEASFAYLRRRVASVGRRAGIAPQLLCQTVWPSERGVEASLSFCKAYKQSWMVHQLAKRKTSPSDVANRAQILWGIYTRAFEHSQSDPDMRWVISYVESTVPWVARTHFAFAQRFASTTESLALPVRMMNVLCSESGVPQEQFFEIGPATPWETMRILAAIARTRPQSYREALDFTSEHIDLTDVSREWRRFGFEREREIIVARAGRQPIAAMVVETGEVGTNLFCLLDSARLISLAPDGKRAYVQLMDEARAWFAARRRTSFLYFREDGDKSYADAARLHDEPGEPYLCIMSARVLPDFLEHVCEIAGSRRVAG
jgi:hypothetical protein